MDVYILPLDVHFRWEVALVGKIFYWALLTPFWGNIFQVLKVHWEPKLI